MHISVEKKIVSDSLGLFLTQNHHISSEYCINHMDYF